MPEQTSRVARKWPYYIATRATSDHSGADEQSFMPPTFSDYTTYPEYVRGVRAPPRDIDLGLTVDPSIRILVPHVKISKVSPNGPDA